LTAIEGSETEKSQPSGKVASAVLWSGLMLATLIVLLYLTLVVTVGFGTPGIPEAAVSYVGVCASVGLFTVVVIATFSVFSPGLRWAATVAIGAYFVLLVGFMAALFFIQRF
jgi:hypothetical protein